MSKNNRFFKAEVTEKEDSREASFTLKTLGTIVVIVIIVAIVLLVKASGS